MKWLEWVFFDVRQYSWGKVRYFRIGWLFAAITTVLLALIAVLIFAGIMIDRHYSQQSCEARAAAIGTEQYQWYDFTFFDYGCYNVSERGTTSDEYQRIFIED